MPRIFEDWEKAQYQTPTSTVVQSDAAEKARAAQARAYAEEVAARPTGLAALEQIQADLATSVRESKERAKTAQANVDTAKVAQTEAAEAQTQARTAAEEIAKETGSYINPRTGKITPNPNLKKPVTDGDGDGGNKGLTFVGYEYNEDFTKRRAKFFNPATGKFTYGEWEDNPKSKADYDAEQAAAAAKAAAQQEKADAFALIEATMRSYGFNEQELKEIIDFIQKGLTNPQMGPNQLALALRELKAYKARFAGNAEREARGLNALSEAEYLNQEQDYSATFRQYGLQRFAVRDQFASLIGNDISNSELGKRVSIAVQRVSYGDPMVLKQLRSYYNITETDIAAYYLNPKEVLPELEAKTTTAEIGATAASFGLAAEKARAEDLRAAGVDLNRAQVGYKTIAGRLPRAQQLTQFYAPSGIEYTQTTAEEEEFKGTASAKRAREQLTGLEEGSFGGASGRGLLARKGAAGII
jgi:hypothetical protein